MIGEIGLNRIIVFGIIVVAGLFIWSKYGNDIKDFIATMTGATNTNEIPQQQMQYFRGTIDPDEYDYFKIYEQRWGGEPQYENT